MSPADRALLKGFVDNKHLFEAVKAVLLGSVSGSNLSDQVIADADLLLDDAQYGSLVRAKAKAVGYLNRGFAQLETIANDKPGVQSDKNSSR
jgi:hypothetical protein